MTKPTDIRVTAASLYFLPVRTRVPLKFGPETLTSSTIARVRVSVTDRRGRSAEGWGETPLSVQWVWPSALSYTYRHNAVQQFCIRLTRAWAEFDAWGHPVEVGHDFQEGVLARLLAEANGVAGHDSRTSEIAGKDSRESFEPMPWLAALVCCSPFDIAVHDAYGRLHEVETYRTYGPEYLNRDLGAYLAAATGEGIRFDGKHPVEFLTASRPDRLLAWHLVGGLDLLDDGERMGDEPDDGYPVVLPDWIARDGLQCLKVKLRGNDSVWDHERLVRVGQIALQHRVQWLSADFNCTVKDPAYVNEILDRLARDEPRIFESILYVEQPFPYDLEANPIDVHSVSARKPLFMDESAHDWRLVRLGRELGWTGVALKTCKTQTGALLAGCWAKAHGMSLMVQDLTNPMLAQIPHVLLAAHLGTIAGVETNAMQFYPEASRPESRVHPGLYQRRGGCVELSSIQGPGFGYRLEEIRRELPAPAASYGEGGEVSK